MNTVKYAPICSAILFLTLPVMAMQISAENTFSLQEYSGNARVVFEPGEKFDISSDSIMQEQGGTVFFGNVVITTKEVLLKTNLATMKTDVDGTTRLRANKIVLQSIK